MMYTGVNVFAIVEWATARSRKVNPYARGLRIRIMNTSCLGKFMLIEDQPSPPKSSAIFAKREKRG